MKTTSPAWSFRGRSLPSINKTILGPGSYSPSKFHLENTPSFRIGTSIRLDSTTKIAYPGPGYYNPSKASMKLPNTV